MTALAPTTNFGGITLADLQRMGRLQGLLNARREGLHTLLGIKGHDYYSDNQASMQHLRDIGLHQREKAQETAERQAMEREKIAAEMERARFVQGQEGERAAAGRTASEKRSAANRTSREGIAANALAAKRAEEERKAKEKAADPVEVGKREEANLEETERTVRGMKLPPFLKQPVISAKGREEQHKADELQERRIEEQRRTGWDTEENRRRNKRDVREEKKVTDQENRDKNKPRKLTPEEQAAKAEMARRDKVWEKAQHDAQVNLQKAYADSHDKKAKPPTEADVEAETQRLFNIRLHAPAAPGAQVAPLSAKANGAADPYEEEGEDYDDEGRGAGGGSGTDQSSGRGGSLPARIAAEASAVAQGTDALGSAQIGSAASQAPHAMTPVERIRREKELAATKTPFISDENRIVTKADLPHEPAYVESGGVRVEGPGAPVPQTPVPPTVVPDQGEGEAQPPLDAAKVEAAVAHAKQNGLGRQHVMIDPKIPDEYREAIASQLDD